MHADTATDAPPTLAELAAQLDRLERRVDDLGGQVDQLAGIVQQTHDLAATMAQAVMDFGTQAEAMMSGGILGKLLGGGKAPRDAAVPAELAPPG